MNKKYKIQLKPVASEPNWYWRLLSRNGRVLAHSEVYNNRGDARKTAKRLATALNCALEEPKQ